MRLRLFLAVHLERTFAMKTFPLVVSLAVFVSLGGCEASRSPATRIPTDSLAAYTFDSIAAPPATSTNSEGLPLLAIPAGFAGVWVEDPANVDAAGADYEAALTMCESGRVLYAVYSNQLYVSLRVTRCASSQGDVFSFYFDGQDVGRGFANAAIQTPDSGSLVATGRVDGEGAGVLKLDWQPGEYWVTSIRKYAPANEGRTIFPTSFYHNMVAMAGLCEEME